MANINFPKEMKIMRGVVAGREIIAEMNNSGLEAGEIIKLDIPTALVILKVKEAKGRAVRFEIMDIYRAG